MATRVCAESELELGEAIKVMVDGVAVAQVRDSADNCFALGDMCSHADISLSEGFVEDDTLECWAHGSKFELTSGKPLTLPAYEPVPVYTVSIVDDDVFIDPTPIATSDSVAV